VSIAWSRLRHHTDINCRHAAKSNLKRVSLELGGKSPSIIFDDANLDLAVSKSMEGILANTGQICAVRFGKTNGLFLLLTIALDGLAGFRAGEHRGQVHRESQQRLSAS
jgi:hypothetical protein